MCSLDGVKFLEQGNMRLVGLEGLGGVCGLEGGKALVGKTENVIGGNLEDVGKPDEQAGIRHGDAAFNPA